jgi:hypothetical protein
LILFAEEDGSHIELLEVSISWELGEDVVVDL